MTGAVLRKIMYVKNIKLSTVADSRAMNPYVAIVEELKQNEMSKFNK